MKELAKRFPPSSNSSDPEESNPAIQLYGRRFYKDQTPVEYLAEFLLVFASRKGDDSEGEFTFSLGSGKKPKYYPQDGIALKLFAFFPSSKLDTRHPVHQLEYTNALELIKNAVRGTNDEKEEVVRLTQSLFSGFVGVAGNRTWVTHSFLPASVTLLARELNWSHTNAAKDESMGSWEHTQKHFQDDRHNFMARGGELLFLQLAHLFSPGSEARLVELNNHESYRRLGGVAKLRETVETGLRYILTNSLEPVDGLANFIENVLHDYRYRPGTDTNPASLGWVPVSSIPEAFLFASEIGNICSSALGPLEKLDLLQTLCCMQVLRSLCFQASRSDEPQTRTCGFIGNYAWVLSDASASSDSSTRKLAQNSFDNVEQMLYRVLRLKAKSSGTTKLSEADKHGFQIFRKLAKQLGLVVPPTGGGQRFALPPKLLRFLVAVLVAPSERIRLTEFYARVFAHYGMALGGRQLATARSWLGGESTVKDYAGGVDTGWVEEALQQGGFLVELSDAVSIVHNPGEGDKTS